MSVIGSTARTDVSPRIFKIDIPTIDCFFSGTGDMFAALTVVRLRQAITEAKLSGTKSWISPDEVEAVDLPLANAVEKVLGSMHAVLIKTKEVRDKEIEGPRRPLGVMEKEKDSEKRSWLRRTKAAELRVVRCLSDLRDPQLTWKAEALNHHGKGEVNRSGTIAGPIGTGDAGETAGIDLQHSDGPFLEV